MYKILVSQKIPPFYWRYLRSVVDIQWSRYWVPSLIQSLQVATNNSQWMRTDKTWPEFAFIYKLSAGLCGCTLVPNFPTRQDKLIQLCTRWKTTDHRTALSLGTSIVDIIHICLDLSVHIHIIYYYYYYIYIIYLYSQQLESSAMSDAIKGFNESFQLIWI